MCGPGLNDDMFSYSEENLPVFGTEAVTGLVSGQDTWRVGLTVQ